MSLSKMYWIYFPRLNRNFPIEEMQRTPCKNFWAGGTRT